VTATVAADRAGADVREEIELVGGPERIFGCRHVPASPLGAGVLVCGSGPFDAAVDQGRVARLGRRLAGAGVAAQRFHYRGTGSSDGDPVALSFGRLVEDAARALDLLREHADVDRVGFVGARLGALVAARLARECPRAELVVWEPVIDPRRLLEHAVGCNITDLLDTRLAEELFEGTLVASFMDELGESSRPLLVVQTGPPGSLRPEYEAVAARGRACGLCVEVACHLCDGDIAGVAVPTGSGDALIDHTADWLLQRLAASAAG
jgi:pimeloyl-ACP methyl ester carboxylesterase